MVNNLIIFYKLNQVTILNKFKQPQANELEKMIDMNGNIPLLPSSRNYNWFTTLDKAKKWLSNGNVITLGRARNPNIKKCGGYFVSSNNIIIQSFDEKILSYKYLYYFLDNIKESFYVESASYPKFDRDIFDQTKIPIPPIEIQNKIVEILNKFTNYKVELTAELTAELTFRKEQYKYYRNILMNKYINKNTFATTLSKVTLINKFKQPQANELEKMIDMNGNIPLLPSSRNYNWFTTLDKAKKWLSNGNVITLGRARNPNIKKCGGYFVSSNNIIIQSFDEKILSYKYLYYFLDNIKESFYVESASYPKFDRDIFDQTKIPIPPIEVQNKIVEILDKFSSLINEISDGLPKEIELRNKQYEYYRNLLLDFSWQNV